jgi:hypothetical protein
VEPAADGDPKSRRIRLILAPRRLLRSSLGGGTSLA